MVYVLNINGEPLMPTERYGKVRRLLKSGYAKVVKREPFTIQLLYKTTNYTQPINLGVDAGTKYIGLSATNQKKVLFEAEVQLRDNIVDLLSTRRQSRRTRRSRKTRYRKPRFNNRLRFKGWLPPSIRNKVDIHLKVINLVSDILPITNIIIEVAQFDIQKIKNPDIQGEEYQQGEQLDFWNVREYVLYRDNHTCQYCRGKSKDNVLNVHHIRSRKTHGDRPGNLITLCKTCHDKIHNCSLEDYFKPKDKGFKDESHFNIIRWSIYNKLKQFYLVKATFGYITKNTRINNGLQKSHAVDARCISGNPAAEPFQYFYFFRQVRKNNRQLHKFNSSKGGIRKNNKAPHLVKGFRLFDKVIYKGQECFIFGRRKSGYFDLRKLDGTRVHASAGYKKLKLLQPALSLLCERVAGCSSPCLKLSRLYYKQVR